MKAGKARLVFTVAKGCLWKCEKSTMGVGRPTLELELLDKE